MRWPRLPSLLARLSTDEYAAPRRTSAELRALFALRRDGPAIARRLSLSLADYWSRRTGTAAGLLALNEQVGQRFYQVPDEASVDAAAADEAFAGNEVVVDVQTHYVSDRPECRGWNRTLHALYRRVAPAWWKGVDEVDGYHMAEYLRCVFVESETAVAVLTSAPGVGPERMLFDAELAGTRALLDRLGGEGRLHNHSVVQPDLPGELERMELARDRYRPVGWKAYTLPQRLPTGGSTRGWRLDEQAVGIPFLERARELRVPLVCVHKGISDLAPAGSPADVGPAAAAFPDLRFVIYHSGYEIPAGEAPEEGPYSEATAHRGTNRLIASLANAGIAPGANVCAELGSTWFCLIRRPQEAAHVLGKLLLAVGEDNVLWGTDAIWYGPSQVALDCFRAFQIPASLRERHGYPELTPERKAKILGRNAARIYGIDLERARDLSRRDDLAWMRAALREYARHGVPRVE